MKVDIAGSPTSTVTPPAGLWAHCAGKRVWSDQTFRVVSVCVLIRNIVAACTCSSVVFRKTKKKAFCTSSADSVALCIWMRGEKIHCKRLRYFWFFVFVRVCALLLFQARASSRDREDWKRIEPVHCCFTEVSPPKMYSQREKFRNHETQEEAEYSLCFGRHIWI